MCALSHRSAVSEHLVEEVRRRRARFTGVQAFDMPQTLPSASSTSSQATHHGGPGRGAAESLLDPHQLFAKLLRNPQEPPVTSDVAESLVDAFGKLLSDLPSAVIDLQLSRAATSAATAGKGDPRLVVVGDTHGQLFDVLHIFEKQGLPSESVMYLFNGDIVDRGRHAVEIWLLVIAFKLRYPGSVHVLRGNHENEQMIARPLKMGGGFSEECLAKYSKPLLAAFQRVFKLLPLFAVVEEEVFVVHGGLFRNRSVSLERLRALPEASWRRNYPNPLTNDQLARGERWTEDEEILFDAQWSDPHYGSGSRQSSRGRVAVTFGEDVTRGFLDAAGLSLCLRSHRVPQSGRGFELEHGGRLLTLFSASRYGGVLQNRGAAAVFRRADSSHAAAAAAAAPAAGGTLEVLGGGDAAPPAGREERGGSSASSRPAPRRAPGGRGEPLPAPPLRRLRLTIVEHSIDPKRAAPSAGGLSAETACQVRRILEQQAREHEASVEQQAIGLVCAEREHIWRQCRRRDSGSRGLVPLSTLYQLLGEICGEVSVGGWQEILEQSAPILGTHYVAYGDFLAAPRVRWFHQGGQQGVLLARAAAQAELRLGGLAALFDSAQDGVVTPQLAREALQRVLPTVRDAQRQELASLLFGDEPTSLSAVLHQLALLADPPDLGEPWMQPALHRLARLIEEHYGPPPLHCALIRFFRANDRDKSELLTADEFVRGFQMIGAPTASGDSEVPLLHSGRLYKLFSVIDDNNTGTVSFLELLVALDDRPVKRPMLGDVPALEGEVPAMLLVHKNAVLRLCRALDPEDKGRVSVGNFAELVEALAKVLGRPLPGLARERLERELGQGEDVAYAEALGSASFQVSAEGGPWRLRRQA